MMKRIFITGANGFIGRNVVQRLYEAGYTVLGSGRQDFPNDKNIDYIRWDFSREAIPDTLRNFDCDCIVHVAASLDKNNLSEDLIRTNCFGTFNILQGAVGCDIKKIIYISSLPIIGNNHKIPIRENTEIDPPTMYHATKAAGELILKQAEHFGIEAISLRVPSPIGSGMLRNTIVPVFINRVLHDEDIVLQGKGTRKQNYLDVRDLSDAVSKIIETEDMNGIYNIGAKNIISNLDLAEKCIALANSKSKIVYSGTKDPSDDVDWTTDDSKLREQIGDYQHYDIEESLLDIMNEMRQCSV